VILVTGPTGYVGGQLLEHLENPVRCLVRDPRKLEDELSEETEVAAGDLLDYASLEAAMEGVTAAYYLVHFMGTGAKFEENELAAARNFAKAAEAQGVERIIYLGGLGKEGEALSPHLRTRHQVGRILRESEVPTVEFRTSIIIGAGSFSFEILRTVVDRAPVMVMPHWFFESTQPIAIDDVLDYLLEALEVDLPESRVYEIGGADQVSYGKLVDEYARQTGKQRFLFSMPFWTPSVSKLPFHELMPSKASMALRLMESLRYPTVVHDTSARADFSVEPIGISEAIARALKEEPV